MQGVACGNAGGSEETDDDGCGEDADGPGNDERCDLMIDIWDEMRAFAVSTFRPLVFWECHLSHSWRLHPVKVT